MTKIVCVGCSWTGLFSLNTQEVTYPGLIKEQNPDFEVYNLGIGGANNFFINIVLEQAIEKLKPDYVVRQVTEWNRWMTYEAKVKLKFVEFKPGYFQSDVKWYGHNVALWTPGSCRDWSGAMAHPNYQDVEYYDNIRLNHYKYMPDQFALELEEASLTKTEKLLQNIPHTILFWKNNTSRLANTAWWTKYPSVQRDIGFHNSVDDGDHFLREGNIEVLDQLINPEMKKHV